MAIIGTGPTVDGVNQCVPFTFNAAADILAMYVANYGAPGTKYGEVATLGPIGLAVTLDTTADTQVRLAHDGDFILGKIQSFENRVSEGTCVVTVVTKGGMSFPIATGHTVAIGDIVGGCTAYPGNVQTVTPLTGALDQLPKENLVTSVPGDGTCVTLLR
ncbi:hypothetical protein [Telmatospirillum sp.]|uniref:hypothetical protein n=1 Tax=Telmatospirillum sp. TaxID=2079197 RepID=UPI00283D6AB1|nr:hypothetical protein [Telmatospirillum sp.]MDR3436427.1 hypothetical protein [Telmatospirillum sp.]